MIEIQLTKGKIAIIDDEDAALVAGYNWYAQRGKHTFYAAVSIYRGDQKIFLSMHGLIMGDRQGLIIDHMDGDGLNNRRLNLRFCNYSQNACNRRAWGLSKYLGVTRWQRRNKATGDYGKLYWVAVIKINGKSKCLGYYPTEEEAAIAYNNAAIEIHGEFARLNIV